MDVDLGDRPEPEARSAATRRCANCRIALGGERVLVGENEYCCDGCAAGGPCSC